MAMNDVTFGKWLKAQRRQHKMVQRDVEAAATLDHSHYSRMENDHIGMPEPETRERIHRVFGSSEDDLVALGLLEVEHSPISGEPYYVEKAHITPGDRAAAEARSIQEASVVYDAPAERHALITHLRAYNLTERQIGALLAVLDAFRGES